ncbi:hypothetical protein V5799_011949 [Amblyomma americanum]|uniref:BPTI/Kunitz inhibitor domain-containing protein n=1 Tax=Amblyomma americanum TaxID=6943 RepID=A0AAQ4EFR4_AMBAM
MSIKLNTEGCSGGWVERYAYNRKTKKCMDYYVPDRCFDQNLNLFETRQECWEKCNPNSVCLKKDEPELQFKRQNKLYYYDPEEDFCFETSPKIAAKNLWPNGNLFRHQHQCIRACKPTYYKINGKDFRY